MLTKITTKLQRNYRTTFEVTAPIYEQKDEEITIS